MVVWIHEQYILANHVLHCRLQLTERAPLQSVVHNANHCVCASKHVLQQFVFIRQSERRRDFRC